MIRVALAREFGKVGHVGTRSASDFALLRLGPTRRSCPGSLVHFESAARSRAIATEDVTDALGARESQAPSPHPRVDASIGAGDAAEWLAGQRSIHRPRRTRKQRSHAVDDPGYVGVRTAGNPQRIALDDARRIGFEEQSRRTNRCRPCQRSPGLRAHRGRASLIADGRPAPSTPEPVPASN